MLTAQVTDKDYYTKLVEQGQIGFSIEAMLALQIPEQQLNQYTMNLPDGKFSIDGKFYEAKDGKIVEVEMEEVVEKEEEVVEEKMEDAVVEEEEVVEEEVKEEMAIDPTTDTEAILAIVTPLIDEKINELLQVIAELKNELADSVDGAPVEDAEVEMSAHKGFSNYVKFTQNV